MGPGQTQILAQELHQQRAGIDIGGYGISVHDQRNFGHRHSLVIAAARCAAIVAALHGNAVLK
jgi:hypothetical protein